MLISKQYLEKIEQRFSEIKVLAASRQAELFDVFQSCNKEEAQCLKFLYAYMPLSDLANYDGDLYLKFVRHSLRAIKLVPWGERVAAQSSIFLNYVLQYRINNENIEFYSEKFFDELYPRIAGMSMAEAAIEVNYWCLEKATYQSTDTRTLSPLSIIRNAFGRCGEESVLAVAALRSVGIPARQCYTPRWSHCDDNHAWVEVFMDGKWNYLGACEPEIRLNTGWFEMPASRGMLMHGRVFSHLVENELIVKQTPNLTEVNLTPHYAETVELVVKVIDKTGDPLCGIDVKFEIINFAEFFPLAQLKTDEDGISRFVTGFGDLVVYAYDESNYTYRKVDVRRETSVELVLGVSPGEDFPVSIDLVPPYGGIQEKPLNQTQEAEQRSRYIESENRRKVSESIFFNKERAARYAEQYPEYREKIQAFLLHARGNTEEIISFLEDEGSNHFLAYKIALLEVLPRKDLSDITRHVLLEHLTMSMPYGKEYDSEIFVKYVLNPRFLNERIIGYRRDILQGLTDCQIAEFKEKPWKIAEFITERITLNNELEYSDLSASPTGALSLGTGNELSIKIAFGAVCRTLGIPSAIEKSDGSVLYYHDKVWKLAFQSLRVDELRTARLSLVKQDKDTFLYHKNYSIAVLAGGAYQNLDLEESEWQGNKVTYALKPGKYRIITANRLSDGTIKSLLYFTELSKGMENTIALSLREKEQQQVRLPLQATQLVTSEGETVYLSELLSESNVVAWLDTGSEPTEHLLNEMMEMADSFTGKTIPIIFILKRREELTDTTLRKVVERIPHIKLCLQQQALSMPQVQPQREDVAALSYIYEGLALRTIGMPLVLAVDQKGDAVFGMAGYHVGIAELLLGNL